MRNIAENLFSEAGIIAFARAIGFTDEPFLLPGDAIPETTHLGKRGVVRCVQVAVAEYHVGDLNRIARRLRAHFAGEILLYIFTAPGYTHVGIACFNVDDLCALMLERGRVHQADVDALTELVPLEGEVGFHLSMRHVRALDRARVGNRFFGDFRAQRAIVAESWQGVAPRFREERDQLALLLLSRLMFLYFLQRRGFLSGEAGFFLRILRSHFAHPHHVTFYRGVLRPLFFGVLNRRPEKRTQRAAALGPLPYLNGGLFERHHLERRFPELDIPDPVMRGVFEQLLERYRFTASEAAHDLAVDPEMLGRVFEGLMADTTRQNTGTFYTPAAVVQRMVRSAFDVYLAQYPMQHATRLLREVRVLDPACGSGAFLLGALSCVAERRSRIENADMTALRAQIVARNLHGVDLQQDAASLCALRLWLALIPESAGVDVQPLPNLDRRIRQGDALVDPLDLAADTVASPDVRAARKALQPLVLHYTTCDPEERQGIHRMVTRRERQLSRAWLNALHIRVTDQARLLRADARARDLFGEAPPSALEARARLRLLESRTTDLRRLHQKLKENGALPFFSFNVHFADPDRTGFDVILCNPPWVRSHNWPKHLSANVRRRFSVCRDAGQVDLALVFLERAVSLLSAHGVLAIILPAKLLRSASAGAAREFLLQHMEVLSIEDHSLDQRSIFGADAFAAIILARRRSESASPDTTIAMIRRNQTPQTFAILRQHLSFTPGDSRSLWLLVPAAVRTAMYRMMENSRSIAAQLQTRRGIVTGANSALILTRSEGRLGDLAWIRSEGEFEGHIESEVIRPLVRGSDIHAWRADVKHKVIFCHRDHSGEYAPPPKRAARYLRDHKVIDSRGRVGALQHVGSSADTTRVAWHDLASTLKAVVLPARVCCLGSARPLVPLNTVYFIATDEANAHLLAAYFNSLPLRTFARAIAERAKDAHFRFFACTVGLLPLPAHWMSTGAASLRDLSEAAHAAGCISPEAQQELDSVIASAYRLSRADMRALSDFDQWLRGEKT